MSVDAYLRKYLRVYVDMYFCVWVYVNGYEYVFDGNKKSKLSPVFSEFPCSKRLEFEF